MRITDAKILFLMLMAFSLAPLAQALGGRECLKAMMRGRIRDEVGTGPLGDQVKTALLHLRQIKREDPEISQSELAQEWRDFASVLGETPYFKSHEFRNGKDIIFMGKREGDYYFLAITRGPPVRLYYGVRPTPLDRDSNWREGNPRLDEW